MITVIAVNCSTGAIVGICHVVSGTREFHFHLWLVAAGDSHCCDQSLINRPKNWLLRWSIYHFIGGLASKENIAIDYSNQNLSDICFCPKKLGHWFKIFFSSSFEFSLIRSLQLDATIWRWRGTRRSRGGTEKRGRCKFYFSQIFVSFFLLHSFFVLFFPPSQIFVSFFLRFIRFMWEDNME